VYHYMLKSFLLSRSPIDFARNNARTDVNRALERLFVQKLLALYLVAAVVLIPSYAFAQSTTHPPVMRPPVTVAYPPTSHQGIVAYPPTSHQGIVAHPPTSPPVTVAYPPTSPPVTVAYPPTSPPVTVAYPPTSPPTASTPTSPPGSHSGGQVQNIESLSFWTTAPGIMTALAAFISALAALVAAFRGLKRRSSSV